MRTGVARITHLVAVAVCLTRIGHQPAIVLGIGNTIVIRIWIAHIPYTVMVGIRLIEARNERAIVTRVPNAVAIGVLLVRIGHRGTVVAGVADAVVVAVLLVGIRLVRAVVTGIADAIPVRVALVGIRGERTIVEFVGKAVQATGTVTEGGGPGTRLVGKRTIEVISIKIERP